MKNSEQPAFPISEEETDRIDDRIKIYTGLTKREYLAGLAMQAILSNSGHVQTFGGNNPEPVPSYVAEVSIELADELLKQLETK